MDSPNGWVQTDLCFPLELTHKDYARRVLEILWIEYDEGKPSTWTLPVPCRSNAHLVASLKRVKNAKENGDLFSACEFVEVARAHAANANARGTATKALEGLFKQVTAHQESKELRLAQDGYQFAGEPRVICKRRADPNIAPVPTIAPAPSGTQRSSSTTRSSSAGGGARRDEGSYHSPAAVALTRLLRFDSPEWRDRLSLRLFLTELVAFLQESLPLVPHQRTNVFSEAIDIVREILCLEPEGHAMDYELPMLLDELRTTRQPVFLLGGAKVERAKKFAQELQSFIDASRSEYRLHLERSAQEPAFGTRPAGELVMHLTVSIEPAAVCLLRANRQDVLDLLLDARRQSRSESESQPRVMLHDIAKLMSVGFSCSTLRRAFDLLTLRKSGCAATTLLESCPTPEEKVDMLRKLKGAGYSLVELYRSVACPLLKEALAVRAAELRSIGCSCEELQFTYDAKELRDGGFTALELSKLAGFTPEKLRQAGFSNEELKRAGHNHDDESGKRSASPSATNQAMLIDESKKVKSAPTINAPSPSRSGGQLSELKRTGKSAGELRRLGHSLQDMVAAGFSAAELRRGGFSFHDLKQSGFSLAELKRAGCCAAEATFIDFSLSELKQAGFTAVEMKKAGFRVEDLWGEGFSARDIRSAWRNILDLTEGGIPLSQLIASGVTIQELRRAGITVVDLRKKGECSASALHKAGISFNEMFEHPDLGAAAFTVAELKAAGCPLRDVIAASVAVANVIASGAFSVSELRETGIPAKVLLDNGVSVKELKRAGVTVTELKRCACSVQQLKDGGFTITDLRRSGCFGAKELTASGCTLRELRQGGFAACDVLMATSDAKERTDDDWHGLAEAGFTATELRAAGCPLPVLFRQKYATESLTEVCRMVPASELREAGCPVSLLKCWGFTASDAKAAGYSLRDLANEGGFTVSALRKANISAKALVGIGLSASELRKGGFSAAELWRGSCTAADLRSAGFSLLELRRAGFDARDLSRAGFTLEEMHAAGCIASELRAAGFHASELRAADFSLTELRRGNYTLQELKDAAFDLLTLRHLNFPLSDFKQVGFTALELFSCGFSPRELREMGFTADDFKSMPQCLLSDLRQAGYSLAELKAAGCCTAFDLRSSGVSATPAKKVGFTLMELHVAGYSLTELLSAGYSWEEMTDAGLIAEEAAKHYSLGDSPQTS